MMMVMVMTTKTTMIPMMMIDCVDNKNWLMVADH